MELGTEICGGWRNSLLALCSPGAWVFVFPTALIFKFPHCVRAFLFVSQLEVPPSNLFILRADLFKAMLRLHFAAASSVGVAEERGPLEQLFGSPLVPVENLFGGLHVCKDGLKARCKTAAAVTP